MNASPDVLIIGGGVVGCACACRLARDGAEVTLVDRGELGHGCSYGNAGWIAPSHVTPLPAPGLVRQLLKWVGDPESPFALRPRLDWRFLDWCLRFLSFTTEQHLQSAAPALAALSRESCRLLTAFADERGADRLGYHQRGLLYVANSESGLASTVHEAAFVGRLGVGSRVLDASAVPELEPAVTGTTVGGVYYPGNCQVEPLLLVQELAAAATEAGARLRPHTEVYGFEKRNGRIAAALTTRGRLAAGRLLIAAGSWTPRIGRSLGLAMPIEAGKGYALVLPSPPVTPTIPTMFVEKKVALTPRDEGTIRLAGTLELAGLDESLSVRRAHGLIRGARDYVALPDDVRTLEVWCGLRPCTPDGLPFIGFAPEHPEVFVAAGHGTLGAAQSLGTAQLAADLLAGRAPTLDAMPFRLDRFRGLSGWGRTRYALVGHASNAP